MKESIVRRLGINCLILSIFSIISTLFLVHVEFVFVFLIFVTIPTLILTIWLVLFIRNRVIKPLILITEEANSISIGNLSHPIIYDRDDELGNFILIFDQMRKRLEQQQNKQKVFEIERKNFITSISHDMKTPIASISAYVEALQDGMANSPEEEAQYFKIIESKLTLLTELSKQLSLSYSLPEDLHLDYQEINCYDWITIFFKNSQSECKIRGISSEFKNEIKKKSTAVMLVDLNQLHRALQNILSNSLRYTKKCLSMSTRLDEQNFYLVMENDGCLLETTNVEKIFERFYTEERSDSQGHLGLGLSISKTIIQSMKGSLTAQVSGDTISFEIQIPLYGENPNE